MHMKSTCNANASLFDANASLFDANAYQMQCKRNANAFRIFHIIANASKSSANASVFYANALLLQDIKEIYIISLYIPFHYIYRERGKIPFRPQNRYKFQRFGIFPPNYLHGSWICRTFAVFNTSQRRLITANNNRWRYFYTASERHIGIVPPWKSVMEILPLR